MTQTTALDAWVPKFEAWKQEALPLLGKGEAKKAFATYPWFSEEGDVFALLGKPAADARFGLITTGGYSIEGEQEPFTGIPGFGDQAPEIRAIPLDVDRSKLRIDHPGYDHRFAKEDVNVNLAADTQVLMGLQPNVVPLLQQTVPELVARLQSDSVEAALLVPS